MSLIPSESLSFPDDFSRSISRARIEHETRRFAEANQSKKTLAAKKKMKGSEGETALSLEPSFLEPLAALQNLARRQQTPAPKVPQNSPLASGPAPSAPVAPAPAPAVKVHPAGAAPMAPASTPARTPIPRKPPLRRTPSEAVPMKANVRPAGPKRFGPVRLPKSTRSPADLISTPVAARSAHDSSATPEAASAAESLRTNDDKTSSVTKLARSRRRRRLVRFILTETVALGILVPCVMLALSHRVQQPPELMAVNIATIASAAVAAILPIVFFAIPSKLPHA